MVATAAPTEATTAPMAATTADMEGAMMPLML
jgi:hypothetical protein